jgi:hypothetical protein
MPCKIWSLKFEFFRSLIFLGTSQNFGQLSLWAISVPDVEEQVHQLASRQWFEWNFGIRVIHKVRRLAGRETASFGLIGHQTCDWEWKFYKTKQTGTQTSFSTNFGCKLSCILSFLLPERLHCSYIYFPCSYLYACYNYSQTLCIKCWVSAFDFGVRSSIQRAHYSAPIRHIGTSRGLCFLVHFFIVFNLKHMTPTHTNEFCERNDLNSPDSKFYNKKINWILHQVLTSNR